MLCKMDGLQCSTNCPEIKGGSTLLVTVTRDAKEWIFNHAVKRWGHQREASGHLWASLAHVSPPVLLGWGPGAVAPLKPRSRHPRPGCSHNRMTMIYIYRPWALPVRIDKFTATAENRHIRKGCGNQLPPTSTENWTIYNYRVRILSDALAPERGKGRASSVLHRRQYVKPRKSSLVRGALTDAFEYSVQNKSEEKPGANKHIPMKCAGEGVWAATVPSLPAHIITDSSWMASGARPGVRAACAQSMRQLECRASCRLTHHGVVRTASLSTENSGRLESNRDQVRTIVSFK